MQPITIVTGASRGIGAATARLCAGYGHIVCVAYRSETEKARSVVGTIEKAGGRAIAVQVDTGVEADVIRLFETVDRQLGRVTGLSTTPERTDRAAASKRSPRRISKPCCGSM